MDAARVPEFFADQHSKDLLRLITCGSVDDGKSTLIGRLLHDTGHVADDQIAAAREDSRRWGTTGGELDLALLVDGLQAEREQGITIDIAHRYFQTARRKFILADTPGHEQYTRNMATAASTADLAVLLVDASRGLLPQTRRHACIARLLGVRHVIVAFNKMDRVDDAAARYAALVTEARTVFAPLGFGDLHYVPISALRGDNVVTRSAGFAGYTGPTLLELLETIDVTPHDNDELRLPVQYVSRPDERFRGYAGTLTGGHIEVGDRIVALPGGARSTVRSILTAGGERTQAHSGESVMLTLDDAIDLARGQVLARPSHPPVVTRRFEADLVWLADAPLLPGHEYEFKFAHRYVAGRVELVAHRVEMTDFSHCPAASLALNEVGSCAIGLNEVVALDAYDEHRATGSFLVIDRDTRATVAAGMVRRTAIGRLIGTDSRVTPQQRAAQKGQRASVLWFTGLSGSGKSTIAEALEHALYARGHHAFLLDGDRVRQGLSRELGFGPAERRENLRRGAEAARLLADAGLIVLATFISPLQADRDAVRALLGADYLEVFVDTPLAECERRDPKGHYRRARAQQLQEFTGISAAWEPPLAPELRVDTTQLDVGAATGLILRHLAAQGRIRPEPE